MAKVSLRPYDHEIEALIEQGQRLDEAIAHCLYILNTFPKHLATYRLLGKAYLEAKRYPEAVDVFQRVLMAAPDDFVAHVGMSIIADEQNKLEEAIWHMERAFEVQPSNAAIQSELQRLFGRRDGVEPPKIRLTRGALAHMYVNGSLFPQAIAEIRAVLSNDTKRVDMQCLLAKAYYLSGQKAEAMGICTDLLTPYPSCFDANRFMVEILPGTQLASSVEEYRQRVNELDPYAAFVQGSVFDSEKVPEGAVNLEKLEYTGQASASGSTLEIGREPVAPVAERMNDQPSWMRRTAAEPAGGILAASAGPVPDQQFKDEPPDFPQSMEQSPAGHELPSQQTTPGSEPLNESENAFANERAGDSESGNELDGSAVEADLPDWVKALAPAEDSEVSPPAESQGSYGRSGPADTLAWLRDAGAYPPETPKSAPEDVVQEDTASWENKLGKSELDEPAPVSKPSSFSNWLNSLGAERPSVPDVQSTAGASSEVTGQQASGEPPSNLGSSAEEQDDALAWLESLAAKQGARPEELVTDPNARTGTAPEWVEKAKGISDQLPELGGRSAITSDDSTGVWLRNLQPGKADVPTVQDNITEPQDLGKSQSDTGDDKELNVPVDKEDMPIKNEAKAPDLLNNLDQTPSPDSPVKDVPEWPHSTPVQSDRSGSNVLAESTLSSESDADLPSWLAGLDGLDNGDNAAAPTSAAVENLPSWLKSEVEPEPYPAEPTSAADWQPIDSILAGQPIPDISDGNEEVNAANPPAISVSPDVAASAQVTVPSTPPSIVEPKAPASFIGVARHKPAPSSVSAKGPAGGGQGLVDETSLAEAHSELGRGNIAAALGIYSKLIRKGKSLGEIIRDLRDALYRYPVEVAIWQALGDAYMRSNRLQEALDSYTKAEELLR